ncbi:unnamed protein product, partial [Symbiodinium sp. KB8]
MQGLYDLDIQAEYDQYMQYYVHDGYRWGIGRAFDEEVSCLCFCCTSLAFDDTMLDFCFGSQQFLGSQSVAVASVSHVEVHVTVERGTFTLFGSNEELTFTTGTGIQDRHMVFTGPLDAVNLALRGASFQGSHHDNVLRNVPDTITISVYDLGSFGAHPTVLQQLKAPEEVKGPEERAERSASWIAHLGTREQALVDTKTISVIILPVNDAPRLHIPNSTVVYLENEHLEVTEVETRFIPEDTPYPLMGIEVTDVDVDELPEGTLILQVYADHGMVSMETLEGIFVWPEIGDEPPLSSGVGRAPGAGEPVNPDDESRAEAYASIIEKGHGRRSDPSISLHRRHIIIEGPIESINAALASLEFVSAPDYFGNDTVHLLVNDGGNTDASALNDMHGTDFSDMLWQREKLGGYPGEIQVPLGALEDSITIPIVVMPVNDPPVWHIPPTTSAYVTAEEEEMILANISITDVDVADGIMDLYINVGHGTVTLTRSEPLEFLQGRGLLDRVLHARGQIDDINMALDAMVYTPAHDWTSDGLHGKRDTVAFS